MNINPAIVTILSPAYTPCVEFQRGCQEMRWNPGEGHVPRGFLGAAGTLAEIELVLVFAEPGDPHDGERHTGLETAYAHATASFQNGRDLFHRNVRQILDSCWPDLSFDQQMRKVWMTESVLCSAKKEGGSVGVSASRSCGERYLRAQLQALPHALVVALGSKAEKRLRDLGINDFLSAYAAAPPGCNRKEARQSWGSIPLELGRRRS